MFFTVCIGVGLSVINSLGQDIVGISGMQVVKIPPYLNVSIIINHVTTDNKAIVITNGIIFDVSLSAMK